MTRRYGIDTSVLVRLITADPETAFTHCVSRLSALIQEEGAEIFTSNQVISEAYVAVRHHYGVTGPMPEPPCSTLCAAGGRPSRRTLRHRGVGGDRRP